MVQQRVNVSIHHLSDIHVGRFHYTPSRRAGLGGVASEVESIHLDSYINTLRNTKIQDLPDLVIISGDLTSTAEKAEFDVARDGIIEIERQIRRKSVEWRDNPVKPAVLVVPGNHDVDWEIVDDPEKRLLRYGEMCESLPYPNVLSSYYHVQRDRDPFVDYGEQVNLGIYLLNSSHLVESRENDQESKKILQQIKGSADNQSSKELLDRFQATMHYDPGYVLPNELEGVRRACAKGQLPKERFLIAVVHHNPSDVFTLDQERYPAIINGPELKHTLISSGYELILHGHRHTSSCLYESIVNDSPNFNGGILSLQADTLGCKNDVQYMEIDLGNPNNLLGDVPLGCLLTASQVEIRLGKTHKELFVTELANSRFRAELMNFRRIVAGEMDPEPLRYVTRFRELLEQAEDSSLGWGNESEQAWITELNETLQSTSVVHATDVYTRASFMRALYHLYIREQFATRRQRLESLPHDKQQIVFSPLVYAACKRLGWTTKGGRWEGWQIVQADSECIEMEHLEIARILALPMDGSFDFNGLKLLAHMHREIAAPLFVRPSGRGHSIADYVLLNNDPIASGVPTKAFRYFNERGEVSSISEAPQRESLRDDFNHVISGSNLLLVEDVISGFESIGTTKKQRVEAARDYANGRHASEELVGMIRDNLRDCPGSNAADLGCGTGNYTFPFVDQFDMITGVDLSQPMLDIAQQRASVLERSVQKKLDWRCSHLLATGIRNSSVSALWSISCIHYLSILQLERLANEIYRILEPGGIAILDTETKEQFDATLWLAQFFPSLKQRYEGKLSQGPALESMIKSVGFLEVKVNPVVWYDKNEEGFLRIFQHNVPRMFHGFETSGAPRPSKELLAVPAFRNMSKQEREIGLARLARSYEAGELPELQSKPELGEGVLIVLRK